MKIINVYVFNFTYSLIAGLPLIIFFSSCQSPHYYKPKPHEPVLLSKSRQAKLNAVSDDNLNAFNIAYSPIKHLGVTGGIASYKEGSNAEERYYNPYLSAGYYQRLPFDILVEAYAGIGLYDYKNKDEAEVKKIKYYNYFVQPSLAYIHKNFEVALTLRVDHLKRYKTEIRSNPLPVDYKFDFLKYDSYYFFQPGCTVRFGHKNIKFQIQATKSNPFDYNYASIYGIVYNSEVGTVAFDHSVKWGAGITIDLAVLKKGKEQ